MSVVTNVIFHHSICEESVNVPEGYRFPIMDQVNEWLAGRTYGTIENGPLVKVDHLAGGYKVMETEVYLGAFNYFRLDEFLAHLKTLPWECPSVVQVMAKGQEEDVFSIHRL